MRLVSHEVGGEERLAVGIGSTGLLDVEAVLGAGPWTMARLLDDPWPSVEAIDRAVPHSRSSAVRELRDVTLLPPVTKPGKIVAVGRNYRDHAAEEGAIAPEDPLLFAKLPSALVADGATITWSSRISTQVDYEAELAVIIGATTRDVDVDRALEHVLGYACLNDVSARDLQVRDGQWMRAKSLDTFCPMGPWLVTRDEVSDPTALRVTCHVNGEPRQDASTRDLIHGVAELVSYCSRSFTLEPGDIIATGTPGGVGAFRDPPVFLADGDIVEVAIEGIGVLRNDCRVAA